MLSDHDKQQLIDQVDAINWYHSIDLGNGVVTKGIDNSANKLSRLKFLNHSMVCRFLISVRGMVEAERRGASRVLSTDSFIWNGGAQWAGKAGYDLAKKTLGSKVEEKNIDVLDLSPEEVGEFDVTFFLGVQTPLARPGTCFFCDQENAHTRNCGGCFVESSTCDGFLPGFGGWVRSDQLVWAQSSSGHWHVKGGWVQANRNRR